MTSRYRLGPRPAVRSALLAVAAFAGVRSAAVAAEFPPPPSIEAEGMTPIPAELAARLRPYAEVRSARFVDFSPDGKSLLISTRFGDAAQLHLVHAPEGRREQITFEAEPVGSGAFIPRDPERRLLFSLSKGGDENAQILRLDRRDGGIRLLTDGKSRNGLGPFEKRGRRCVVSSNARNGRDTDLFLLDPTAPEPALAPLLEVNGEFWNAADFSFDDSRLALVRNVSVEESYPFVLDLATREKTPVPPPPGAAAKAAYGSLRFAPDGRSLFLVTDAASEWRRLARVDLSTGEYAWLSGDVPWDVESVALDPTGRTLAFSVNEDGASVVHRLDVASNARLEPLSVPLGVVASLDFSPDGERLAFTLATPAAPADVWVAPARGNDLVRWTVSETGGIDPALFVAPTRIQFPTFDTAGGEPRRVPAWLYLPRGASARRKAPVVIQIHGGPEGQSRPAFSPTIQQWVNELSLAVLVPNVRGSTGYGKTYVSLDNAEKREDSVKDVGALLDWIRTRPDLDASRVAVHGGSYGGYMVLASLVHFGERIKAGVDVVGIADFTTFLTRTSAYRQDLRRAEYGDERDPRMREVFARISPLARVREIRSPLLVAHGKNDPRVPFHEALEIAKGAKENGIPVWTVYADDEGHGFAKKKNSAFLDAAVAHFFRTHLVAPAPGAAGN